MIGVLAIPDPRKTPIEPGWAAQIEPYIEQADDLDQVEAQLAAHIGYAEKLDQDCTEFEKARRLIDVRKAALNPPRQGERTDLTSGTAIPEVGIRVDSETLKLLRRIERHWSWLRPLILQADSREKVTRAAVLREVRRREKRDTTRRRPADGTEAATIELAGYFDWLPTQPDCDLLITDPPYSTDVPDVAVFAYEWVPLALSKVKPSGRAYVCIGSYPNELAAYLNAHIPRGIQLVDVLVWSYRNTIGPSSPTRYTRNWQAILHYVGPDAPPLNTDSLVEKFAVMEINAPDGRQGDRLDAWQKPDELADRLIHHATQPGDIVLDPFAGTGTFLVAAAAAGCKAAGCDVDPAKVTLCKERGCV